MAATDPLNRLAEFRIEVSGASRQGHLAAISSAVRTAPPVRAPGRLGFRRRWAVAIASLAAIVTPVGAAVAAEGALPGELLYPVKSVSESIRGIFDEDLAATHRVEELEALLDAAAAPGLIAETETRAGAEIALLDDPGDLLPRLERAQERIRTRARLGRGPGVEDQPVGPGSISPGVTTVPPGSGDAGDSSETNGTDQDPDRDRDRDRDGSGSGSSTSPPGSGGGSGGNGSGGGSAGGNGSGEGSGTAGGGDGNGGGTGGSGG